MIASDRDLVDVPQDVEPLRGSGFSPHAPAPGAHVAWPRAVAAVWSSQLSRARVARVPLLFVATLQSAGLVVLLRGVVSGDAHAEHRQVVAGAVVLVAAFVALNLLAQRLGALKAAHGLDYYAALPVPGSAVVLGTAGSYAVFALPGALLVAVLGAALYDLPYSRLWLVIPVLLVGGAALAGTGAVLGLLPQRHELATVLGQLGMSLVLFLGLVRPERLWEPLRLLRGAVPGVLAADALAAGLAEPADVGAVVSGLAVSAAMAVLTLSAATVAYRRAVRR